MSPLPPGTPSSHLFFQTERRSQPYASSDLYLDTIQSNGRGKTGRGSQVVDENIQIDKTTQKSSAIDWLQHLKEASMG